MGLGRNIAIKYLKQSNHGTQLFGAFSVANPLKRLSLHVAFWCVIATLSYLTYSRVGGDCVWIFVVKEMMTGMTLFYAGSWFISRGVRINEYRLGGFYAIGYIWWVSMTFLVCYIVRHTFEMEDRRFETYINFVLEGGYFSLFTFKKSSELVLDYIYIITLTIGPKLVRSYADQSKEKVQMERDQLAVQLNFLKSESSLHFLFNTLNSIHLLVSKGDERAPNAILQLSTTMRYVLYEAKDEKLPLKKEVQFIQHYVSLMKMRYGDHVSISLTIDDDKEPYRVVPMLLMPFIENAFKHGPERSRKQAWVQIELAVADGMLRLNVGNHVNRAAEKPPLGGLGTANVMKQLKLYYPNRHSLQIRETETEYHIILEIHL
ncbi:sensor histidine kinase [Parapedobacter sp. 10938]|uniref:sensor histidine kinase n=1 Tax=Parapedobacter flavus TaxID=3110225 RepID=UPI002DB8282C|nr:histidine kinase [Parapedobacter sp. 10938]MEC3878624.1 histidine kinase [Parapedobacter sp. 10938]